MFFQSLKSVVLIYYKHRKLTVGRRNRAHIHNQKRVIMDNIKNNKKQDNVTLSCISLHGFQMWIIYKWKMRTFHRASIMLTNAFLLLPHLHSSSPIMHTQPFRAVIDASMSRLFPWIRRDPIHFSVFPNAGLKAKHVGSGGASGSALPRRKKACTSPLNEVPIMCLFIQVISDFPFPNLVGQTAI